MALVYALVFASQVVGGDWTEHGFLFKPSVGARGQTEKNLFDSGQDRLDARLAKEIWVGDPQYGATLPDAVTAIGSNPAALRVPAGAYTISANLTIPANITLKPERGAVFSIPGGKTLSINGSLECGLYQVFSGSGTVVLGSGSVKEVYPEWWGAKGDDATDSGSALQAAANACGQAKVLYLSAGVYRFTSSAGNYGLTVACPITGTSSQTSVLRNTGTGSALLIQGAAYYTKWQDFAVIGNVNSQDGIVTNNNPAVGQATAYCRFRGVDSHDHGRHGLVNRMSWATRFFDCKFYNNGGLGVYGYTPAGDAGTANGVSFINCESRWNGGTGDASADFTKGGVRITGANGLVWLGGVVESNNAWGFIISEQTSYPSVQSITISGVFLEDNPRSSGNSTIGGNFRLGGTWDKVLVENCWMGYGAKVGATGYCFYVTTPAGVLAAFTERNNYATPIAGGTQIRDYKNGGILENDGLVKQNLLANSGFGVWSNSTPQNVGVQISITGITAGVCATTNTQGLAVGKLVKFGAGGTTANKVYEVTALVANTSFTLHDTSITDATAVTCYEVTPGCVAADDKGPDGWNKTWNSILPLVYREFNGPNTKGFYGLKIVSTETAIIHGLMQSLHKTDSVLSDSAYQHLLGRTVTFGCWVKADAVGVANIQFYDQVANPITGVITESRTNLTTGWEWLEVTRTFPTAPLDRAWVALAVKTTGHTVYFARPVLAYGKAIGYGNYSQPDGETIFLEAPVFLTNFNNTTDATSRNINLEAESDGKLPKGLKAVNAWVSAKQSIITAGDSLWVTTSNGVALGLRAGPQVPNITVNQVGWVKTNSIGDLYAAYSVTAGSFTSQVLVSGVQLR